MDIFQNNLHPNHLEDLKKSGLFDETIQEAGFYSVRPGDIPKKLGYNNPNIKSLLAIPYPGCNGFERYKPFSINPDHAKYLQKKDSGNRLYIPPRTLALLKDPAFDGDLIFTEGEKKTLAGVQAGLAVIGLSGLWNWSDGGKNLIEDFDKIDLKRRIIICPDSDWLEPNKWKYPKNLKQAVFELGGKLIEREALVSIKDLPKGPNGEKMGLDDFLLTHSPDQFFLLPGMKIEKGPIFGDKAISHKKDSQWPSPLAEQAFHGIAGKFVKMVEPHTEADPVAILIQFLVGFGNIISRGSWFEVEADRHYLNLFCTLVGKTSKGRKGVSHGQVKKILKVIDSEWVANFQGGLSSGEGLIWAVRDEIIKQEPIRDRGKVTGYQDIISDPGIKDKRLLIVEEELASVLKVMEREGNLLSPIIRKAWDDGCLKTMTKNNPAKATNAHVSIIGHITKDELRRYLTNTESGNGFANRFIWLCVRRSRVLPEGGRMEGINFSPLIMKIKRAMGFGKEAGEIRKDNEAKEIWSGVYQELSEGKPGLLGAVTSRAEAQVMRLACLFAVLDESRFIRKEHLLAALALWDYSEASARYIFGDATGDRVADQILEALRGSSDGLTRTEISGLFGRNRSADRIEQSLSILAQRGSIQKIKKPTEGRAAERWMAI